MARRRASGVGARGSRRRASSRSVVMSETCTERRETRGDSHEHVDVARDERALGDDGDGKPALLGERLEHTARDAIPSLRRLVRIGRRADHDRLSQKGSHARRPPELAAQDGARLSLHEDAPLEREPGRQVAELLARRRPPRRRASESRSAT